MEPNEIRAHAERMSEKPADLIKQVLIKANIGILQAAIEEAQEHQAELEKLRADVAALREDAERLARQSKTSTVYMSGEQPFRPSFKVMGLQGASFRSAIDAAQKGGA